MINVKYLYVFGCIRFGREVLTFVFKISALKKECKRALDCLEFAANTEKTNATGNGKDCLTIDVFCTFVPNPVQMNHSVSI
jgi:hypothetical protein